MYVRDGMSAEVHENVGLVMVYKLQFWRFAQVHGRAREKSSALGLAWLLENRHTRGLPRLETTHANPTATYAGLSIVLLISARPLSESTYARM